MDIVKSTTSVKKDDIRWFVMVHLDINKLEELLKCENSFRLNAGKQLIEYFIPYRFLRERISTEIKVNGEPPSAEMRHFVFIKASAEEMQHIVESDWNRYSRIRLTFYRDRIGRMIEVPECRMRKFLNYCITSCGRYEIWPPIRDVEKNSRVQIKVGAFAGDIAYVSHIKQESGRLNLTLSIPAVSGVLSIKMKNVTRRQIVILDKAQYDSIREDFIDYTQDKLLIILAHRAGKFRTDDTDRNDAAMLDRLYCYRNIEIAGDAARRHFLALMLMCAHFRHDVSGQCIMVKQAEEELKTINAQGDKRASTDVRAYLWIALYLATGNAAYRNAAKLYVQQCNPKSPKLRRFISLIRNKNNLLDHKMRLSNGRRSLIDI